MIAIILDKDCTDLLTGEAIKTVTAVTDSVVVILDSDLLSQHQFHINCLMPEIYAQTSFERVLFLSRFSNGILKYHTQILTANPVCWFVSILDMQMEAQRQNCKTILLKSLYHSGRKAYVVFDSSKTLAQTKIQAAASLPTNFQCLILHRNHSDLANRLTALIQKIHPDWECQTALPEDIGDSSFLDCILIAGRKPEDFAIPGIDGALDKLYLWIELTAGSNQTRFWQNIRSTVLDTLSANGWVLMEQDTRVMLGYLDFEEMKYNLERDIISQTALVNDDRFIQWDAYGLPVAKNRGEDLDSQCEFMLSQCVLEKALVK